MRYEHLISHFGSLTKAARELRRPKQTIWNWKNTGIPDVEQLELQRRTKRALRADRQVIAKFRRLLGAA